MARLEHLNFTVSDPQKTAAWISRVFGWSIRWEGPGMETGYSIHVGNDDTYVALFRFEGNQADQPDSYHTKGGLNHWAVVVDDLDATAAKVKAEGFTVGEHYDYEPGHRFYFYDTDGIEVEVVQYD